MFADIVTMHIHAVRQNDEPSEVRLTQLVYPHEMDITRGMASVLTFVGAGLIGLCRAVGPMAQAGWTQRPLTVLRVSGRMVASLRDAIGIASGGLTTGTTSCLRRPD